MPLNYSKWDRLEVSDDSDIEGHPNVDHRSLVRWKQRDIHEKREQRKHNIARLRAQIDCNNILLPRIVDVSNKLSDPVPSTPPTVYFNSLVERLGKNPSGDCPPGNDPTKLELTYDGMLLSLLRQVSEEAKAKVKEAGVPEAEKQERIAKALADGIAVHLTRLKETIDNDTKSLENEEKDQKKHITSEDIHEGFASKYVPPKPEPAPIATTKIEKNKKQSTTAYEVLNPQSLETTPAPAPQAETSQDAGNDEPDEEDEGLPELTPSLEAFSKIPLKGYEKSFEFIQLHRDVVVPGASDALLVAAFRAQSDGKAKYAKQCVHQSLLLQYCDKLGKDGVGVFFRKMISGDRRAEKVFVDDIENTYNHLVERVRLSLEESSVGKEQIQLVPENPEQTITFNVPPGPPPEQLVLEGPEIEGMDVAEVRQALQFRWDVFHAFPEELKKALESNKLEEVNRILGDMDVSVAESIVQQLDMAGILNFADGGIRDATSAENAAAA